MQFEKTFCLNEKTKETFMIPEVILISSWNFLGIGD